MVLIPLRPAPEDSASPAVSLALHPVTSPPGLLLKVEPPLAPPAPSLSRTPCDIVLVIDVSGSMGSSAPVPGDGSEPNYGFSVLDLTKHAALTILETLTEEDRLGIVTFSNDAQVLRTLGPVTAGNKDSCRDAILGMSPRTMTNLWGGIKKGLKLFEDGGGRSGRNPALFVLTDGMPNHTCPAQGYVPKLLQRRSIPAAIHTFGFGYDLRSGLLKSIADVGGGGYAYIPDSSMLGTVFIHAVANLQSAYADSATVTLRYPRTLKLDAKEATGLLAAGVDSAEVEDDDGRQLTQMTIRLDALQYGQSRDFFLRAHNADKTQPGLPADPVSATLTYSCMVTAPIHTVSTTLPDVRRPSPDTQPLTSSEEAYHVSRSLVCTALGSLFRLHLDREYVLAKHTHDERVLLIASLAATLPAQSHASDPLNASLLAELDASADGQIPLAASPEYFPRWGAHYLLGLKSAHERQACNSFKDPGPLMYARNSPLFARCRDALDDIFDNLDPPPASLDTDYTGPIDMASYRDAAGPCFTAETPVRLAAAAAGREGGVAAATVRFENLRRGMVVETPTGPRRVASVLKTEVAAQLVCRVADNVLATPWHPVSLDGARSWVFPADVATANGSGPTRYTGAVYSTLLEEGGGPEAHALGLGSAGCGVWGVALGHGVTRGEGDVRAHAFLGDYVAVKTGLEELPGVGGGVVVCGGVRRDAEGLACGFVPCVPGVKGVAEEGLGLVGGGSVQSKAPPVVCT